MMIAADFMLSFLLKAIATGLSASIMRHSGLLKATKQIDLPQLSYRRKKIRWKRCELVRAWIRAGSTRLCNTDGQHPPASVQEHAASVRAIGHAAVGRRETNVACVIDTVVPLGPVETSTCASSCRASALIKLVPRPAFLGAGVPIGHAGSIV